MNFESLLVSKICGNDLECQVVIGGKWVLSILILREEDGMQLKMVSRSVSRLSIAGEIE
jgi:hypothetical protein